MIGTVGQIKKGAFKTTEDEVSGRIRKSASLLKPLGQLRNLKRKAPLSTLAVSRIAMLTMV
jgi:hypothetical protein